MHNRVKYSHPKLILHYYAVLCSRTYGAEGRGKLTINSKYSNKSHWPTAILFLKSMVQERMLFSSSSVLPRSMYSLPFPLYIHDSRSHLPLWLDLDLSNPHMIAPAISPPIVLALSPVFSTSLPSVSPCLLTWLLSTPPLYAPIVFCLSTFQ